MAKESKIKQEFPTLEDLMYNNKGATKRHKKKKSQKQYRDFLNSQKQNGNPELF